MTLEPGSQAAARPAAGPLHGTSIATRAITLGVLLQRLDPTPVLVADDGRRTLLANGSRP